MRIYFIFLAHTNNRPNWQIVGEDPNSGPIEDSRQEFQPAHTHWVWHPEPFQVPGPQKGLYQGAITPGANIIFERLTYRGIKSWRILVSSRGFFEDYIFAWWNIWVSTILLLRYYTFLSVNGKATVWHNPCSLPTVFGGDHISLNHPPRKGNGD
jgi:hypothetical protein